MPTATANAPSTRELRKQASDLQIPEWESLGRDKLASAIKAASKGKPVIKAVTEAPAKTKRKRPLRSRRQEPEEEDRPARRVKKGTKKVKVHRRVAPEPEVVASNGAANPFRAGSNNFKIAELLLKGGRRQAMVTRLKRSIDLHPYAQKQKDMDVDFELHKRILLCAQSLEKKGFKIVREGRGGAEGKIKAVPPKRKR